MISRRDRGAGGQESSGGVLGKPKKIIQNSKFDLDRKRIVELLSLGLSFRISWYGHNWITIAEDVVQCCGSVCALWDHKFIAHVVGAFVHKHCVVDRGQGMRS